MQNFKRALLAGAVGIATSVPAAAAPFTGAYFFGDSLTDMGSFKPVLPPGTGLFTTNPGPTWPQPFAQHYGFSASPANQGGNDYAYGGARVALSPGYPPIAPTAAAVPIATQIQQFLTKGPLDPNAIYSYWGGANDFFTQYADLTAGKITSAQAQANLALAGTQLVQQIATLRAAGAQYILVWNYPAASKTPDYAGNPAAGQIDALVNSVFTAVYNGLDAAGIPTIRVNVQGLVNEIIANPAAYGFTNVTAPACGTTTSLVCTSANFVAPNAASTYLFADGVHATTAGQAIYAQAAESMIDGPQQIATLPQAAFAVEDANFRALDGRMWSSLGAPRTQKKLEAWAAYDYGSSDMNAGANNGSADTNTIAVGMDSKVTDKMLIGGMFGYAENKGDFGGPGGGYKLRQPTGTIYAGYGEGPWYVGVTVGAGALDYSDVNRNIPLGAAIRTETGQTRGWEYTGRLLGGYWFHVGDVLHGPYARLTYTKSEVHAYSETASDSTALSYGAQDREQLLWSLGWQIAGNIGSVRPFARVTWEYDSMDQTPSVTASSASLGGSYTIPGAKPDNSYALFNVGASADFGGVTGYITGSGTAARGDGNYYAITVGIRAPI
jgi:outer membrane lipase/esterase